MERNNRFTSPVLLSGIASALILLLGEWGLYEKIGIKQEVIQHTIDFILFVYTSFAVTNNPKKKSIY